jgi:hypothetical protein
MRAVLIAVNAFTIWAQTPPDPTDVLAHARDNMVERAKRLPNYTCVQTVDREYFVRSRPATPYTSCDQMSAEARKKPYSLKLDATDRLRLDVKVSGGEEIGSWAGANRFDSRSIVELVGGPFGSGQFGPLVLDVFVNIGTAFQYIAQDPQDNSVLFHYTFQVPVVASHLMIRVAGGGNWIATSYDGDLWIDADSFDLQRFSVRTSQLSQETDACEARMIADYARVRFDTGDFLIPRQSTLHFIMRDTEETEITSRYSSCREYRGQSTLSFADVSALNAVASKTTHAQRPLPAGLKIALAFTSTIDTDTAAAGDVVMAKVLKPVQDNRSKEILIPAGATVQGRIIVMKRWLAAPAFHIAILLEALDVDGVSSPLYVKLDRADELRNAQRANLGLLQRGTTIILPPIGQSMSVGSFVFRTNKSRYVVPPKYESNWVTILPGAGAAR